MIWYKFIVYGRCFIGGILETCSALVPLFGLQYSGQQQAIYDALPALRIVDQANGIVALITAALVIYAGFGLLRFKASSVKILLAALLLAAVRTVVYRVAACFCVGVSPLELFTPNLIGRIIGSVGLFVICLIYFDHRKHLFTEA